MKKDTTQDKGNGKIIQSESSFVTGKYSVEIESKRDSWGEGCSRTLSPISRCPQSSMFSCQSEREKSDRAFGNRDWGKSKCSLKNRISLTDRRVLGDKDEAQRGLSSTYVEEISFLWQSKVGK